MWVKIITKFLENLIECLSWIIFLGFTVVGIVFPFLININGGMMIITLPIGMFLGLITNVIVLGPFCLLFNINNNIRKLNERNVKNHIED